METVAAVFASAKYPWMEVVCTSPASAVGKVVYGLPMEGTSKYRARKYRVASDSNASGEHFRCDYWDYAMWVALDSKRYRTAKAAAKATEKHHRKWVKEKKLEAMRAENPYKFSGF